MRVIALYELERLARRVQVIKPKLSSKALLVALKATGALGIELMNSHDVRKWVARGARHRDVIYDVFAQAGYPVINPAGKNGKPADEPIRFAVGVDTVAMDSVDGEALCDIIDLIDVVTRERSDLSTLALIAIIGACTRRNMETLKNLVSYITTERRVLPDPAKHVSIRRVVVDHLSDVLEAHKVDGNTTRITAPIAGQRSRL